MAHNLSVGDLDLPEMAVLVKDHKQWDRLSGKAVPSRPIVSGNSTINSHLSEILSELIEPIALRSESAEVQSSEEALHLIDELNKSVTNSSLQTVDPLDKFRSGIESRVDVGNSGSSFERELQFLKINHSLKILIIQ